MVWYGMVFFYSTSLYIIYIAHHYNITQDAEREMHEVQYLYVDKNYVKQNSDNHYHWVYCSHFHFITINSKLLGEYGARWHNDSERRIA